LWVVAKYRRLLNNYWPLIKMVALLFSML
jgi:hypothetical protein